MTTTRLSVTSIPSADPSNAGETLAPSKKLRLLILAAAHGAIAVTAMLGGGALAVWPSGKMLGVTPQLLAHSPFSDFLLPGLLIYALGVFNIVTAYFCALYEPKVELLSGLMGVMLLIWISAEAALLHTTSWLQIVYGLLGMLIVFHAAWSLRFWEPGAEGS